MSSFPFVDPNGVEKAAQLDAAGNLLTAAARAAGLTVTHTVVPVGTSSTPLVAANPNRKYLAIYFVGTGVGNVYVNMQGQAATAAGGIPMKATGARAEITPGIAPLNAITAIADIAGQSVAVIEG